MPEINVRGWIHGVWLMGIQMRRKDHAQGQIAMDGDWLRTLFLIESSTGPAWVPPLASEATEDMVAMMFALGGPFRTSAMANLRAVNIECCV